MSGEQLKTWSSDHKLATATLSQDGSTLSVGDTEISGSEIITIADGDSQCAYSVASLYLQLRDPNQSLLQYRQVCKKHNVNDFVAARDKKLVLSFFLGDSDVAKSDAPQDAPRDLSTESAPSNQKAKARTKHGRPDASKKQKVVKKGPKDMVTNEQLFDSLTTVVGKRQQADSEQQKKQEELFQALSPSGFAVTPELLEKHKPVSDDILVREMPVGTSASVLRAPNPKKDLSKVLALYYEVTRPTPDKGKSARKSKRAEDKSRSKLKGMKPVIIVPKAMTCVVTLANARIFLSDAKFVPRDVLVKSGRHRNAKSTFTRTFPGRSQLEYEIIDNPRNLDEWERIVAVIVLGEDWQFKDWKAPVYNTPASLFDNVFGYYIGMEGDKVPKSVGGWAVQKATLNRDKRGMDQVAYASFWNGLDEWMKVNKPDLLPESTGA